MLDASPSDYALLLKDLPEQCTSKDLQKHFQSQFFVNLCKEADKVKDNEDKVGKSLCCGFELESQSCYHAFTDKLFGYAEFPCCVFADVCRLSSVLYLYTYL